MTLPKKPFGGKGGNNSNGGGPRQPKGIPAGGEFTHNLHSEPDSSLGDSLGNPTMAARFAARQKISKALRGPLNGLIVREGPDPQAIVFRASNDGLLIGAAQDSWGNEIKDSRLLVGRALREEGIQASLILSSSDDEVVVSTGKVNHWRSMEYDDFAAEEEAAAAPQPGALPPLPFRTRETNPQAPTRPTPPPAASHRPKPTTDGQPPKRPTLPPELAKRRGLPPQPTLSASQTPKGDSSESAGGQPTGSYFGPTDPADINPELWPTQDGDGNHKPLIIEEGDLPE